MLTSDSPSFRLGKYKPLENYKNDQDQSTQFVGGHGACAAISSRFSIAQCKKHLKILILGGTGIIGPHIVRETVENFVA